MSYTVVALKKLLLIPLRAVSILHFENLLHQVQYMCELEDFELKYISGNFTTVC